MKIFKHLNKGKNFLLCNLLDFYKHTNYLIFQIFKIHIRQIRRARLQFSVLPLWFKQQK